MLKSWTDTTPMRQSGRMLCTAAEHLLEGATAYLVDEPTPACPQCDTTLGVLAAPVVAQGQGEAFATLIQRTGYCPKCPVVVVESQRLEDSMGDRADDAQLVGILVGGASDRGSDTTVYPFGEVRMPLYQ